MKKLFFDFEMTGLHQYTTPISLGVTTLDGISFYCEFTDYDRSQVDSWIQEHVIDNLMFVGEVPFHKVVGATTLVKGDTAFIRGHFRDWLSKWDHVEFWGDTISYDGILLNGLFGGTFNLPSNVDYIFYDIATLFKMLGIDPDISREAFSHLPVNNRKHNALYDAEVIVECYTNLKKIADKYRYPL